MFTFKNKTRMPYCIKNESKIPFPFNIMKYDVIAEGNWVKK